MPWTKAPQMQIGQSIAVAFNGLPNILRHPGIRGAIKQDAAGVAQKAV